MSKKIKLPLTVAPWGDYLIQEKFFFRPRQAPCSLDQGDISSDIKAFHQELKERNNWHIEYCSGHGHWIVQQAQKNRDKPFLAVEMKLSRATKILSKARQLSLNNLWIVCAEASWFNHYFLPLNSVEKAYIHFPDPWPKRRHAEHRLFNQSFLNQLKGAMNTQGELSVVSDDLFYCQNAAGCLSEDKSFESVYEQGFKTLDEGYGNSYFETLWRSLGRDIYHLHYRYNE